MKTYSVIVKGTWSALYDVIAASEENAIEEAKSNAVIDSLCFPFSIKCTIDKGNIV